eukprot:CAMPEP_0113550848 /NCGR_PEP_ID=MMETSP0015_2-20120614/14204_1 /TAXON_ID=2838 /ORGANISM="Odontella" /LENGTH=565 /DNA_ID=CAMNT_0000451689 /DNA_START=55 /DNA_END=1752 /DNA_ORIENTATION=+ /assembly_acc=CAM_ASM_000160
MDSAVEHDELQGGLGETTMSSGAASQRQTQRTSRSFLSSVRRLLWNAGHRSSMALGPSTPSDHGRKRQRDGEQPQAEADNDLQVGNRGELPFSSIKKTPPHLVFSNAKTSRRSNHPRRGPSAVDLVSSDEEHARKEADGSASPPAKRARTAAGSVAAVPRVVDDFPCSTLCSPCAPSSLGEESSLLLSTLPPDVISFDVLSFLPTSGDRRALQLACKQFQSATDREYFLARLDIGGVGIEGKRGILLEGDTPQTAVRKLLPFSRSGNMQAVYMLAMLKAYCFDSPRHGIALLRMCADQGYVRAEYALGLILRDTNREESRHWLLQAAKGQHLPAYQEILPAQEVKARFGDLDAERLRGYLDFPCLNRLLGRHYVDSNPRSVQTSHCWNPLCGRWAYKATPSVDRYLRHREARARRQALESGSPSDAAIDDTFNTGALYSLLRGEGESTTLRAAATSRQERGLPLPAGSLCWPPLRGAAAAVGGSHPPLPWANHGTTDRVMAIPPPPPAAAGNSQGEDGDDADWILRVSRMKMCSSCRRAKYCSKLCQVYDWRSGRHKTECQYLAP